MTSGHLTLGRLAAEMRRAATDLIDALTEPQRALLLGTFAEPELTRWTYLPGHRPGVEVRNLSSEQRTLASALLRCSYGPRGAEDAERVVRTEALRRGLPIDADATSILTCYADPEYYVRVLGDPRQTEEPWLWRVTGHHLVAQAVVLDGSVSGTPQFFGTQPAQVLHGPYAGFRGLPHEEDFARQLVTLLGADQRRQAVLSARAPADIVTRDDPAVAPGKIPTAGLAHARMDTSQRQLFEALIRQYVDRAAPPVADRAWADLHQAGIENVTFSWAGGLTAGQGHYYAVSGPTLLLEYDNTQEHANHVHTVWRDLRHDWGGDVLTSHYQRQHRSPQRPGAED
jgi:hypothetical protein